MTSPVRLAVLECDNLIKTRKEYGGYCGVYTTLLHAAADNLGIPHDRLAISKYDVINEMRYPSLDEVDAMLISGSRIILSTRMPEHSAFDNSEWVIKLVEYTQKALAQNEKKVIGVCYGHQIVGRALGAKVARSESGAWEVSVCQVRLTPKGKELFRKDILNLHQMHRDVVCSYPKGVEELGWSDTCKVQAMYMPKKMISVEAHPEFNEDIMREILQTRKALGIFDQKTYDDAMTRIALPHDGVVVGEAFLRFLLED